MSAPKPQSEEVVASYTQTEDGTTSRSQPSQATSEPEWRQPTATVDDNPYATELPRKFRKHQSVWVARVTDSGQETVEATVTDFKKSNGNWYYQLKDKNETIIWRDNPTWVPESQISAG